MRLSQVGYDANGKLRYPRHDTTAPESALQLYLTEARDLLSTPQSPTPESEGQVNTEFDHLRWFDLPSSCLSSGKES
jgi:hypothetical protein